jgi:hypothetical protein
MTSTAASRARPSHAEISAASAATQSSPVSRGALVGAGSNGVGAFEQCGP